MMSLPQTALAVLLGLALDAWLGEARRWHPLVGFGRLAGAIERRCNRGRLSRLRGVLAWMLAVLPPVLLAFWLLDASARVGVWLALPLHALLLYFCVGLRSLHQHNAPIAAALHDGDLVLARQLTARIVSRDTDTADSAALSKASVESLLENGCDAVFGTLFWFAVGGGAAALLYRLANTLDAMWGYKTARWLHFGWAAARIDDVLNWIPARLTAISYALLGNTRLAWRCWREQAPRWPSPNAGPVMAAGAGALGLALGGAASYDGIEEQRPPLGCGSAAGAADIERAWRLVRATAWLWCAAIVAVAVGVAHA